jgi:hypothetical protein
METNEPALIDYRPGPVEVHGRRLKMEYMGMASVFTVIALLIYGGRPWGASIPATLGSFFLFLGLKKKNRDHLMCSFLLFLAAALARPAVVAADWAVPMLLFGATVFSLERYLEKRPQQAYGLPVVLAVWGWLNGFWLLGLLFAATYLLYPRADRPEARKILVRVIPAAAVAGGITTAARLFGTSPPADYWPTSLVSTAGWWTLVLGGVILVAVAVVIVYWKRLIQPHRLNSVVFAVLAPWDVRLAALFGMVAAVLMAATVFRHSIDSDRARPFFKHAEWHFFYVVLALAIWAVLRG